MRGPPVSVVDGLVKRFVCSVATLLLLAACQREKPAVKSAVESEFPGEVPILKAKAGDLWKYRVVSELHHSNGTIDRREGTRIRRALGLQEPVAGMGKVDVFEVSDEATPLEREFVEIQPETVLMRGSLSLRDPQAKAIVLEKGVPLVKAGMRGGEDLPEMKIAGNKAAPDAPVASRKLRVIGRERVETPAGNFDTIKILMTGLEGSEAEGTVELRRTIWFAPGDGIVREDKERSIQGKTVVREEHWLVSLTRAP